MSILLVVDDDRDISDSIAEITSDSFEVRVAECGRTAAMQIAKIVAEKRTHETTILTDWRMPNGGGAEVIRLGRLAGIKIILVMTATVRQDTKEILDLKPNKIFTKPFDIEELEGIGVE